MYQTSRVVGRDDSAAGLGDGIEFPLGEPAGHTRPIQAEGAAEPATVRDVWDIHNLIASESKQPSRLLLEAQLAQGLARVVVRNLEARSVWLDELRTFGQKIERKARRIAKARAQRLVPRRTPIRCVDGERAEAGRRRGHDHTLGIPKALGQPAMQIGASGEVPGVGGDQAAAPLPLWKPNLVAGAVRDLS